MYFFSYNFYNLAKVKESLFGSEKMKEKNHRADKFSSDRLTVTLR